MPASPTNLPRPFTAAANGGTHAATLDGAELRAEPGDRVVALIAFDGTDPTAVAHVMGGERDPELTHVLAGMAAGEQALFEIAGSEALAGLLEVHLVSIERDATEPGADVPATLCDVDQALAARVAEIEGPPSA